MSTETESSQRTRPSLLARLKDWSQQTAWREFDQDYAPLLRNVARKAGLTDAEADEVARVTLIAVAKKIGGVQHVLQGMSVRNTAQAAGASMAAVYMAKSRVSQFFQREIKALRAQRF